MKKTNSFLVWIGQFISSLVAILFYSRFVNSLGGFIIWSFKGFKTSLKDEINDDEYDWKQPYYKRFLTPSFIGFVGYIFIFIIVGVLIMNKN